jgi:hypothetical protein
MAKEHKTFSRKTLEETIYALVNNLELSKEQKRVVKYFEEEE